MTPSTSPSRSQRAPASLAALVTAITSAVMALLPATPALAQSTTAAARTVRVVVPYPPGSTPDALARIVADLLPKRSAATVVVDNRPGAGGMIGARFVSEAAADGGTLLMFTPAWPAARVFMKKPPIAVPEGLEPITIVAEGSAALMAASALPARNFNELVAYARANPGKINFATTGLGDSLLYFHLMQRERGMKFEAIQYKGSAEYVTAMMSNDVQLAFTPQYSMVPFVREGKLRVLAVTGSVRSKVFPDAPTFAELGFPQVRNNWFALFGPRALPAAQVDKLNAELVGVIRSPEAMQRISAIYFEPVGSSADQLRRRIDTEIREWTELMKQAGLEPQ